MWLILCLRGVAHRCPGTTTNGEPRPRMTRPTNHVPAPTQRTQRSDPPPLGQRRPPPKVATHAPPRPSSVRVAQPSFPLTVRPPRSSPTSSHGDGAQPRRFFRVSNTSSSPCNTSGRPIHGCRSTSHHRGCPSVGPCLAGKQTHWPPADQAYSYSPHGASRFKQHSIAARKSSPSQPLTLVSLSLSLPIDPR